MSSSSNSSIPQSLSMMRGGGAAAAGFNTPAPLPAHIPFRLLDPPSARQATLPARRRAIC